MRLTIRRIAVRFALLLALAAVVPLVAYGVVSILSLQRGTRESIVTGNENVATRAAEEIREGIARLAGLIASRAKAGAAVTGVQPTERAGKAACSRIGSSSRYLQ